MIKVEMEAKIVVSCVYELLEHGFLLSVDNGGDDYEINRSSDGEAVFAKLMKKPEERLIAIKDDNLFGWVHFVYGNSGYDVICDMTVSLASYTVKTQALSEVS